MLAAVATGLALVTGCACSREPGPIDPPPTGSSPTLTTTPTPPPPTLPAAARADSRAGAEAFARYWLVALDYAYQTGNTTPFLALGECKGCRSLSDAIGQVYNEGGRFEGGRLTVGSAVISTFRAGHSSAVVLRYARTPRKTIRGDGQTFDSPGAANLGFLMSLERAGNDWTVVAFPTIG